MGAKSWQCSCSSEGIPCYTSQVTLTYDDKTRIWDRYIRSTWDVGIIAGVVGAAGAFIICLGLSQVNAVSNFAFRIESLLSARWVRALSAIGLLAFGWERKNRFEEKAEQIRAELFGL